MRNADRALVALALLAPLASFSPAIADSAGGASALTVTPSAQSATKGAAVSLTVRVDGGSADQQLSYVVVGRNDGVHGSVETDSGGTATISYRDHGVNPQATSDEIAVFDATDDLATATVDYLDGPDYADAVAVDSSGSGFDDASCGGTRDTPATGVTLARATPVCAAVTNTLGEPLAGKAVTFAVSTGAVGAVTGVLPGAGTTYLTTTDRAGMAFASVTSTTPGTQDITATADRLAGTASVGYAPPAPDAAASIVITPSTATFTAGVAQRFVASVRDEYGNPVTGVEIGFSQSGTGTLAPVPSQPTKTADDGTATATVTTQRDDAGPGALAAAIDTAPNQCGAGACSVTASYTVDKLVVPAGLTLEAAPGPTAGAVELVGAIVTSSDGTPAAGQAIHFSVSGVDAASGVVRTNPKGVALFGYRAERAGVDTVRAFDDSDGDGRVSGAEPGGSLRLVVAAPLKEHPTIQLTAPQIGEVVVRVTSRPRLAGLTVTYEVRRPDGVHAAGRDITDRRGVTARVFWAPPGARVTIRARVSGRAGVVAGVSRWRSIRVATSRN